MTVIHWRFLIFHHTERLYLWLNYPASDSIYLARVLCLDRQSFLGCVALPHKLQCKRYDFGVHEIHMKRVFDLFSFFSSPPGQKKNSARDLTFLHRSCMYNMQVL